MNKMNVFVASALLIAALIPADVFACSVCFGDPNSPMTHGAKAAVLFLLGVVTMVLGGIVAITIYWIRRARLLQVQAAIHGESTEL